MRVLVSTIWSKDKSESENATLQTSAYVYKRRRCFELAAAKLAQEARVQNEARESLKATSATILIGTNVIQLLWRGDPT